jgi:hypothetical protein
VRFGGNPAVGLGTEISSDPMPDVSQWLALVTLFVLLPVLTRPETVRVLSRLANRLNDWATTHAAATEEKDEDEVQLWLVHRRRQLGADLARIEHLLATDSWMSATRQRGNRLAYDQLVDELRRIPDVFEPHSLSPWDPSAVASGPIRFPGTGYPQQQSTVEVLEIGWRRPRRH